MISTKQTKLSSCTDARLVAYAAVAGSALAASTAVTTAQADIVYSGPVNIAVPDTFNGIYLNLVTGEADTEPDPAVAFDIDVYDLNGLNFTGNISQDNESGILVRLGTQTALALQPGYLIGPSVTVRNDFEFGAYGTNFRGTGTELLGLVFTNETTGTLDYGWIQLATVGDNGTGFPATITGYAYDDSGAAIPAGAVPEPTTTALLGAMAVGALGVRQWRRRQASRQAV